MFVLVLCLRTSSCTQVEWEDLCRYVPAGGRHDRTRAPLSGAKIERNHRSSPNRSVDIFVESLAAAQRRRFGAVTLIMYSPAGVPLLFSSDSQPGFSFPARARTSAWCGRVEHCLEAIVNPQTPLHLAAWPMVTAGRTGTLIAICQRRLKIDPFSSVED